MSFASWKREFYTSPAHYTATSTYRALQHSLKKWQGLTKTNLTRHNLIKYKDHDLVEIGGYEHEHFAITADSCALCHQYMLSRKMKSSCSQCPIYLETGMDCDGFIGDHDDHDHLVTSETTPYKTWIYTGNPRKMITLLRKLVKKYTPSKKKKRS